MWLANLAYNWLDTLHVASSLYNFAPFLAASSFHLSMRPQENSPYGPINPPISFACALLACRSAYLAAMPCMITELRKVANASPQSISGAGSHPATSLYQFIHCEREGRPGVSAEGINAGLVRLERAELGGFTAKQYGVSKLERSDKGWPIVDISQLEITMLSRSVEVIRFHEVTYSSMPITFGSVLWYTRLSIL